ncbi:SGT1 protein-domain-containing protein [Chytriomyces sp. MP71]|nr:SGT1 protein-domain-containing protein [Chytriomyces sp. MP71]
MPQSSKKRTRKRPTEEPGDDTLQFLSGKPNSEGSEDCASYRIHAAPGTSPERLLELHALVSGFVASETHGHIWQKEPFKLSLSQRGNGGTDTPFLYGRTRFGDCVDDEWLIVYLLRKVTEVFEGIVASIEDSDGQFLLIEAAHFLPSWLSPSIATNRVFLANGELHILPLPKTPAELAYIPSGKHIPLDRALHVIRTHPDVTVANREIQEAAFTRCQDFPQKLQVDGLHYATCIIPRGVARILKADEGLVSAAVEAFYLRDPLQLKACQNMTRFHPSTNLQTSVRFTRTLYAQLMSQEFLAAPKGFRIPAKDATDFKAHDLGMKLALGFEMLAARDMGGVFAGVEGDRRSVETYPFETDPRWRTFHERLTRLGYYKSEVPGSSLYKTLLRAAQESHFSALYSNDLADNEDEHESRNAGDMHVLAKLHRALGAIPEDARDEEVVKDLPESDDAWLYVDPDELERIMETRMGHELNEQDVETDGESEDDKNEEKRAEKRDVRNLERVVAGFGAFVDKESTVDGALFPGENESDLDSEDDDLLEAVSESDESSDNESLMDQDQPPLNIDNEKFMESLMRILSIDNTILHNPTTSTAPSRPKKKNNLPTAPPASFNPSALLLRATPTTKTPLVTLDDSDDDAQDLSGARGVGIVGNRRGVQEDEGDSDDENEEARAWDRRFLRELEKVEDALRKTGMGEMEVEAEGGAGDEVDSEDDDSDLEDIKLEEYMAAMDAELSKSKVGRSAKQGVFGEAVEEEANAKRPKWKLKRMEQRDLGIDSGDEDNEGADEGDLDMDSNLVKNLLESLNAQHGLPGPASNILGRLGLKLPKENNVA